MDCPTIAHETTPAPASSLASRLGRKLSANPYYYASSIAFWYERVHLKMHRALAATSPALSMAFLIEAEDAADYLHQAMKELHWCYQRAENEHPFSLFSGIFYKRLCGTAAASGYVRQ